MKLNRVNSAIDRTERNKLNENFDIIERGQSSIQNQVNQLVVEGDSSVEAAQARVSVDNTVYDTLKKRLDAEKVQTDEAVNKAQEKTVINAEDYGVEGNRNVDESPFIQDAITAAINSKLKTLVLPKKTYRLETPFFIGDQLKIDFLHSELHWYGEGTIANNGNTSLTGMINIWGDFVGGGAEDYIRNGTIPTSAARLLTLENVIGGSRITTSDNSAFNVGDYVFMNGWTRETYTPYDTTLIQPELKKVIKITAKDDNYLYTDYSSPFIYSLFAYNDTVKSIVVKVNLVENVKIKNVTIVDMVNRPADANGDPVSGLLNDTPCGISGLLTKNLSLENVTVKNHRFNAIKIHYSNNSELKNISAHNAQWWSGGKGYLLQLIACDKSTITGAYGDGCRHVVDVSWASNCHTKDAKGINSKGDDFTHHGCTEHDVYWEDCVGVMGFNHHYQAFAELVKKVGVRNSYITLKRGSHTGYVDNIIFENTTIIAPELGLYNNTTFANCVIVLDLDNFIYTPNRKNDTVVSRFILRDSRIILKYVSATYSIFGLKSYDDVIFENVQIDSSAIALGNIIGLHFSDFKNVDFNNVTCENIGIFITQDKNSKSVVNIAKSSFDYISKTGMVVVNFGAMTGKKIDCMLNGVVVNFTPSQSGDSLPIYNASFSGTIDSEINLSLSNNRFNGESAESINTSLSNGVNTTIRLMDYKNLIKNKKSTAVFSADNIFV